LRGCCRLGERAAARDHRRRRRYAGNQTGGDQASRENNPTHGIAPRFLEARTPAALGMVGNIGTERSLANAGRSVIGEVAE
jgi:hypothetical protein